LKLTCLGRGSSDFYVIWHTGVLITTCPGIDTALEEGFVLGGKGRFWCAACKSVSRTCSTSTLFNM